MAKGTFGYFRFKINGNNLSGDYMNWDTKGLQNEQGNKIAGNSDEFVGSYKTRWTDTAYREAEITIDLFHDNTFELTWVITNTSNKPIRYRGRGVIREENVLTGFYEMLP